MRYHLEAPAKINLTLEVLGDLPGGYHQLDTVFATLELADQLSWQDASETRLRLTGTPSGMEISEGEDNLVLRALHGLESLLGRAIPLEIELEKRIPAGGGLGGGSGDAAALLVGVNRSHQLGLSEDQLLNIAQGLGADVAFGLQGGVARGTGKGDTLEGLPDLKEQPEVVLIFPPFPCPTGAVYRAWDAARPQPALGSSQQLVECLQQGQSWSHLLINDLEPAAQQVEPALLSMRQALEQAGLGPVVLCGSGSTLSCWGGSEAQVQQALQGYGCRVLTTRLSGQRRR